MSLSMSSYIFRVALSWALAPPMYARRHWSSTRMAKRRFGATSSPRPAMHATGARPDATFH
eukprot:1716111-Lingulodinium_polyedra.AAC.1